MNKILLQILLLAIFSAGCSNNMPELCKEVSEEAAASLILSMKQSPRYNKIKALDRIGILAIENDNPVLLLREQLTTALLQNTALEVLGVDDMKEKQAIWETQHNQQIRYSAHYNEDTLVSWVDMLGLKTIMIGMVSLQRDYFTRTVIIALQAQVLDLEKGRILWSGQVAKEKKLLLSPADYSGFALVGCCWLAIMFFLGRSNFFYGNSPRQQTRKFFFRITGVIILGMSCMLVWMMPLIFKLN
jgi:hypothetical protein